MSSNAILIGAGLLITTDGKKIASAHEQPLDHHPLRLKANPYSQIPSLQMKATILQNRRAATEYAVPQHGITEQKNYASAKRSVSKKKQRRLADGKFARTGGEAKARRPKCPLKTTTIDSLGTDSDPSEEPLTRTTSKQRADILPPTSPTVPKASHKKTGRPPARRGKLGRNQYTRDRDPQPEANTSPARSNSAGAESGTPHMNGIHSPHIKNGKDATAAESAAKPRLKHLHPTKTTMTDMKRRVAAILEFISHTQVEMAAHSDVTNPHSSNPTPPDSGGTSSGKEVNGGNAAGTTLQKLLDGQGILDNDDGEAFAKLSSVEMMEVLTRRLMRWQGEYGK